MLVDNIMRQEIVDAILSVWMSNESCLTYTQIKNRVVEKKLITAKNDRSLSRWLDSLTKNGQLRKTSVGYYLETMRKEYHVFDYINELRQKFPNYISEGGVGGWFTHICASTYLNFDDSLVTETDEKVALDTINQTWRAIRISLPAQERHFKKKMRFIPS